MQLPDPAGEDPVLSITCHSMYPTHKLIQMDDIDRVAGFTAFQI